MTSREQQLTAQLEQCQQALAAAQRENTLLRQKLDALARRIFGVSSEALDPAQLQLLLQMPELSPQAVETLPLRSLSKSASRPAKLVLLVCPRTCLLLKK
jgi:hypothetical protein